MRKTFRSPVFALGLLTLISLACNKTLEAPPVEVEYRDSLVGIGKIVRITNRHTEPLTQVVVRIENPNRDVKNHTLVSLLVGETTELGWKKLDGFEVEIGAEVTIRSDGFVIPYRVKLESTPED